MFVSHHTLKWTRTCRSHGRHPHAHTAHFLLNRHSESGTAYSHSPHNASETRHFDHPHKVMLGLYIGAFLGMLSETSMNIALPDLMDEFSVSSGTAQWMVVGYMLAIGVVLPCVGFMLKWIKAKTLVLFALTCFLVGALVCTVATGFPVLLAGRIVQGISTGIVLPPCTHRSCAYFHRIGSVPPMAWPAWWSCSRRSSVPPWPAR